MPSKKIDSRILIDDNKNPNNIIKSISLTHLGQKRRELFINAKVLETSEDERPFMYYNSTRKLINKDYDPTRYFVKTVIAKQCVYTDNPTDTIKKAAFSLTTKKERHDKLYRKLNYNYNNLDWHQKKFADINTDIFAINYRGELRPASQMALCLVYASPDSNYLIQLMNYLKDIKLTQKTQPELCFHIYPRDIIIDDKKYVATEIDFSFSLKNKKFKKLTVIEYNIITSSIYRNIAQIIEKSDTFSNNIDMLQFNGEKINENSSIDYFTAYGDNIKAENRKTKMVSIKLTDFLLGTKNFNVDNMTRTEFPLQQNNEIAPKTTNNAISEQNEGEASLPI